MARLAKAAGLLACLAVGYLLVRWYVQDEGGD